MSVGAAANKMPEPGGAVTGPAVLQPRMPGDAVPEAVPGRMPTDLLTSMPSGQTRQQGLLVR